MNKPFFHFELIYQSKKSGARVGRIHTPHGIIETPNFVPVGTNATAKALDSVLLDELDVQLMFCNTYHLMLQPGTALVKEAGGLHSFMNRKKPIITDSGGFQVFSLMYGTVHDELKSKGKKQETNAILKINEDGVLFRSYRDGATVLLTPETSVQAQKDLGADIIIPFDELPAYHTDQKKLVTSLERTHRWEQRSLEKHLENRNNQAMYAVIHGGVDNALRKKSCDFLTSLAFDGFAIGGSLGKTREQMLEMLTVMMPHLPTNKPNHLLGIGDLPSLEPAIKLGIDTFDSSHPTRCARHGLLFTQQGMVKILNEQYKHDFTPPDVTCDCYTCRNYTKAYLRHLFKAHELTAYHLTSLHNVYHMMKLFKSYRAAILQGQL
ncbi:MAG: tRNA-guanosine(34) transglycosylase [Proteobacteria bacterium]|nr:tRNA-guanosine(34) transglycosylase [Pseudomonadota bacterium]NBP15768.1 tRNA-guanosine(34) transglycosylase [bacterium]